MTPLQIVLAVYIAYFGILASLITLWLALRRPLWLSIVLNVWMLICFTFAAGVTEGGGQVRALFILLFAVLLGRCLIGVYRLEQEGSPR